MYGRAEHAGRGHDNSGVHHPAMWKDQGAVIAATP